MSFISKYSFNVEDIVEAFSNYINDLLSIDRIFHSHRYKIHSITQKCGKNALDLAYPDIEKMNW